MSKMSSTVASPPRTHAIEFCLFISVTALMAIAILDSTGGSVTSMYTMVADALAAAAAV
jgi:Flp pilus assembly pilin Flp